MPFSLKPCGTSTDSYPGGEVRSPQRAAEAIEFFKPVEVERYRNIHILCKPWFGEQRHGHASDEDVGNLLPGEPFDQVVKCTSTLSPSCTAHGKRDVHIPGRRFASPGYLLMPLTGFCKGKLDQEEKDWLRSGEGQRIRNEIAKC